MSADEDSDFAYMMRQVAGPIHYSGPLCIVRNGMVTRHGGGTGRGSCACTGKSFSDRMNNTWDRTEVTCKSCLKQIERHDFSARMYPNEKAWDGTYEH